MRNLFQLILNHSFYRDCLLILDEYLIGQTPTGDFLPDLSAVSDSKRFERLGKEMFHPGAPQQRNHGR